MKTKLKCFLILAFALCAQVSFSQDVIVSGKVTDSNGLPIPGANVKVQNSKTIVQTDFDGEFKVKANIGQILEFSYIGMTNA